MNKTLENIKQTQVRQLKSNEICEILTNESTKPKRFKTYEFETKNGYIILNPHQQLELKKALEIYFPRLYTEIYTLRRLNPAWDSDLNQILEKLNDIMSSKDYQKAYDTTPSEQFNFLRQLRTAFIMK